MMIKWSLFFCQKLISQVFLALVSSYLKKYSLWHFSLRQSTVKAVRVVQSKGQKTHISETKVIASYMWVTFSIWSVSSLSVLSSRITSTCFFICLLFSFNLSFSLLLLHCHANVFSLFFLSGLPWIVR